VRATDINGNTVFGTVNRLNEYYSADADSIKKFLMFLSKEIGLIKLIEWLENKLNRS